MPNQTETSSARIQTAGQSVLPPVEVHYCGFQKYESPDLPIAMACAPPPVSPFDKHRHYFKDTSHLQSIDVYRVISLFGVTDPCIGHALKKLLVAGGRGAGKGVGTDIQEAIDSLLRYQEMQRENEEATK